MVIQRYVPGIYLVYVLMWEHIIYTNKQQLRSARFGYYVRTQHVIDLFDSVRFGSPGTIWSSAFGPGPIHSLLLSPKQRLNVRSSSSKTSTTTDNAINDLFIVRWSLISPWRRKTLLLLLLYTIDCPLISNYYSETAIILLAVACPMLNP